MKRFMKRFMKEDGARRRAGWRIGALTLVCCVAIAAGPGTSLAESGNKEMAQEAGIGVGSALVTLLYAPVKLAYATGGLVVGGLAWAFSGGDAEVANVVLTPSLRGSYVITPSQLRGDKEIEFFGRKPEYRANAGQAAETAQDVASAPVGWLDR
jgi:hypothetical protein